jgi:predicted RNA methylase
VLTTLGGYSRQQDLLACPVWRVSLSSCNALLATPAVQCSLSLLQIDFVLCDVNQVQQQQRLQADTVIMNPPFGTKMKGADMAFLRAACSLGPKQIYSLNKSSTRSHIQKVALK